MIQILEYIAQNYTLFLSVLILILLAIIGYYADKTNFGQDKNKEKEIKDKIEESKVLSDVINTRNPAEEKNTIDNIELINSKEESILNQNDVESTQQVEQIEITGNDFNLEDLTAKREEQTKELEEIDSLLPKKELINSDLLNEIEEMEFNSIKEKTSFDVPDLDDIRLPKIKNLVEKEQDIWKF